MSAIPKPQPDLVDQRVNEHKDKVKREYEKHNKVYKQQKKPKNKVIAEFQQKIENSHKNNQ